MATIFITLRIIFPPPLLEQLGVGRGDGQIGVGEQHVHVRDHRAKEPPSLVHFLECGQTRGGSGFLYRFHATTSVCEKQKKASGSRPHARQAAAIPSRSERVAMPCSNALSARPDRRVRSANISPRSRVACASASDSVEVVRRVSPKPASRNHRRRWRPAFGSAPLRLAKSKWSARNRRIASLSG